MNMLKAIALAIIAFTEGFGEPSVSFTLRITDPASQMYHVEMKGTGFSESTLDIKMPVWTPGYYQVLNYAQYYDSLIVTRVDWQSPAWNAGLRSKDVILKINTAKASKNGLDETVRQNGDMAIAFLRDGKLQDVSMKPVYKKEKRFKISLVDKPSPRQQAILKDWLKN